MPDALLRLRYAATDGAGATAALQAVLGSGTVAILGGSVEWTQDSLVDDGITISRLDVRGSVKVTVRRTNELLVVAVQRGEVELTTRGEHMRLRVHDLALVPIGASAQLVTAAAELELFAVPAAPLARLLGVRAEALQLRAPLLRPRSDGLAAYLAEVCRFVTSETFEREEVYQRDLIRAGVIGLLAATIVEAFELINRSEQNVDRDQAVVRRALAFMREHLRDSVSIPEVADAAGVSVRALQLAFRRQLDTSPLLHLRQLRMEAAREELMVGRRDGTTIAAVAGTFGYTNPGRFSTHYRNAFDEPPSAALERIGEGDGERAGDGDGDGD